MRANQKFPPTKCIGIDVDGTLINKNGKLNRKLADWAKEKKDEGWEVILWTAQGKAHAMQVAKKYDIEDHFTAIIGKVGYIVDDLGWSWIKYTKRLKELF